MKENGTQNETNEPLSLVDRAWTRTSSTGPSANSLVTALARDTAQPMGGRADGMQMSGECQVSCRVQRQWTFRQGQYQQTLTCSDGDEQTAMGVPASCE